MTPELTQDLGRTPSIADAAEHLGWTSSAVREAELADQGLRAVSIDAFVGDGWVSEQPPEWDRIETRVLLNQALRGLSEDERELLRLRFVDELSQIQIAVALGINQMGVSRRLARLMRRLRAGIGDLTTAPTNSAPLLIDPRPRNSWTRRHCRGHGSAMGLTPRARHRSRA